MNYSPIRFLLAGAACLSLCGCLDLKPVRSNARYFILSALPAPAAPASAHLAVGVGQVKLPSYLFKDSLAVRQGTNEVEYLDYALWAEQLPAGFQRVLAADLAALLPTDQVRLTAWSPQDVSAGVYVTVERFDVDAAGHGTLAAWWRITSPNGEKLLKAGHFHAARQGPSPQRHPQGATATLSGLLADLSRELAKAIQDLANPNPAAQ
jgi:uncharacterized lipoprotein YmbA